MQTQRDFLIVSPYFPPSGAPTAQQIGVLAQHLLALGHTVDVIAAGESAAEPAIANPAGKRLRSKGLNTYLFATPSGVARQRLLLRFYRFLRPTDPYLHYGGLLRTLTTVLVRNRYRFILSIADPLASHEAVLRILRPPADKIAFYFSDPVPCVLDSNMMRLKARRRRCQQLANRCVEAGALCWAPAKETFGFFRGGPELRDRLLVVPHYFDPREWPFPPVAAPPGQTVTVLHSGALYYARRPHTLLEGIGAFRTASGLDVRARLQGYCDPAMRCGAEPARYGFACFEDSVPLPAARQAMAEADILCIIDCDLPKNVHLPSKLSQYVGACKPILYLGRPDSPSCRLLRDVHPAFAQALTADEVVVALRFLLGRRQTIGAGEYRPAYELLRVERACQPLIERLIEAKRC